MQFIFVEEDISDTRLEKYIELATQEKAPELYKPRAGKIGKNNKLFNEN